MMPRFLMPLFCAGLITACSTLQQNQETQSAEGILKHYPSDVMSTQAWYGHNYMLDQTPLIPTEAIPEALLQQHIGKYVRVTGSWFPGKVWKPTPAEMNTPMPVDPGADGVVRGDGILAASLTVLKN